MNNSNGKTYHEIRLDKEGFKRDVAEVKQNFKSIGQTAAQEGQKIDSQFARIGKAIGGVFTLAQAASFTKKIIEVRGEIESLETSFTTLLNGNKKAMQGLMTEMRQFAVTTPMMLNSLAKGAQTMLGFGIPLEQVMENLRALGDISMGDDQKFQSLTLAFSQMSATGKLMGQDLLQMINAGFNPLMQISERTGKSVAKLKDEMSKGAISADMVRQAFIDATSEGGKFNGMLESMSKTSQGAISNAKGAIEEMMNSLGEKLQPTVVKAADAVYGLAKNYEETGRKIAELIAVVGAYKAALVACNVVTASSTMAAHGYTLAERARYVALLASEKAQKLLNATMLKNPYVLVAASVAGLAYGMYKLITAQTDAEKAQKRLNDAQKEAIKQSAQTQIALAEDVAALKQTREGTEEWERAKKKIIDNYSSYGVTLNNETLAVGKLADTYRDLKTAIEDSYNQQAYEKFISDERARYTDLLSENLDNIKKDLKRSLDKGSISMDEYASAYQEIATKMMAGAFKKQVKKGYGATDELTQATHDVLWKVAGDDFWARQQIEDWINETTKARYLYQGISNVAKKTFGVDGSKKASVDSQTTATTTSRELTDKEKREAEQRAKLLLQLSREEADAIAEGEMLTLNARKDANERSIAGLLEGSEAYVQAVRESAAIEKEIALQQYKDATVKAARAKEDAVKDREKDAEVVAAAERVYNETLVNAASEYYDAIAGIDADLAAREKDIWKTADEQHNAFMMKYGTFEQKLKVLADRAANEALPKYDREAAKREIEEFFNTDYIESRIREMYPLFDNLSELTRGQLEDVLKMLESLQVPQEILDQLRELGVEVEKLEQKMHKSVDNTKKEVKSIISGDVIRSLDTIVGKLRDVSNSLSDLEGRTFEGLAGAFDGLAAAVSGVSDAVNVLNTQKDSEGNLTMEGKASLISTAISNIIGMVAMVGASIQANRKAQKEWNNAVEEAEQKYRMLMLAQLDYEQRNIFGVENPYQKAIDGTVKYREAMKLLNEQVDKLANGQVQTGTKKVVDWNNVGKGAGMGAAAGAAIGSILPGIGTAIGAAIGGAIGLVTGAVAGAFSTKTVPVLESLASRYGELFDAETFELNERILADYDKMDDETKKLIDNWNEIRDAAKKAQQEMRDTIKDLAGGMGDQLQDALVNAWRSKKMKKAVDDYKDYVLGSVEDIIESMVFDQIFGDLFTELQHNMEASFGVGGDNDITDDMLAFLNAYPEYMEMWENAMNAQKEVFASQGFDLWKPDASRTSTSKSGIQVTQDSFDEGLGRLTAMQSHTFAIAENSKILVSNTNAILRGVNNIDDNTASMDRRMENVEKDMKVMRSLMSDVALKGVKVR